MSTYTLHGLTVNYGIESSRTSSILYKSSILTSKLQVSNSRYTSVIGQHLDLSIRMAKRNLHAVVHRGHQPLIDLIQNIKTVLKLILIK